MTRWVESQPQKNGFFKHLLEDLSQLNITSGIEERVNSLAEKIPIEYRGIPDCWAEHIIVTLILWYRTGVFPWRKGKNISGVHLVEPIIDISTDNNALMLLKEITANTQDFFEYIGIDGIYQCWSFTKTTGSAFESNYPPSIQTTRRAFAELPSGTLQRLSTKHASTLRKLNGDASKLQISSVGVVALSKHVHRNNAWLIKPEEFKGPLFRRQEMADRVLDRFLKGAEWRNLHETGGKFVVFELRMSPGLGIRWQLDNEEWKFRGFLEVFRADGHEHRWRFGRDEASN